MNEIKDEINGFSLLLGKYIKKDKIHHAYLIETNDGDRIKLAKELIKQILNFNNNNGLDQLNDSFDLQIITTDLQTIKKEQILNLKEKFKTKSIYNSKRIYIIEEAEKLNNSSANTLLKFLEEPEENIIAILVTGNRNLVINTIVSRCQIIRYYVKENINLEYSNEYSDKLFEFIMCLEEKKEKSIAYINKLDIKQYTDRQNISQFLKAMLYVYDDVLHKKIGLPIEYFGLYEEKIDKIAINNKLFEIKNKINAINICNERIKYNTNIKLLLDKLILLMAGVDFNV